MRRPTRSAVLLAAAVVALGACTAEDDPAATSGEPTVTDTPTSPTDEATLDEPELGTPADEQGDLTLALAGNGLVQLADGQLAGSVTFGTSTADTVTALQDVYGLELVLEPGSPECPAGIQETTTTPDGVEVNFRDGTFVGYAVSDLDAPRTLTGHGIGSTFAEFEEAFPSAEIFADSTLGVEFFSDAGYAGILDDDPPEGTIITLWNGDICAFR